MRSQNWPRDRGSTPVVGSSRMRRSGIVDERAAEAELLLHAAGELAGRTRFELLHGRRGQKLGDARATLFGALAEQAAEEVDVLEHAQRRVEVAAEALRHIGDAAADLPQCVLVGDVLVEDDDLALLNFFTPAISPSNVDLPTPSGPITPTMMRDGMSMLTSASETVAP